MLKLLKSREFEIIFKAFISNFIYKYFFNGNILSLWKYEIKATNIRTFVILFF